MENPNQTGEFYKALASHVLKRLVLSDALSSKKNTVFEMIFEVFEYSKECGLNLNISIIKKKMN